MRDEDKERSRIKDRVERMAFLLDLGWLDVACEFHFNRENDAACESVVDTSQYRVHVMRWNPAQTATMIDADLDATIVHELVHGLLGPLWDQLTGPQQERLKWFNERVTEDVTRAIVALLPK